MVSAACIKHQICTQYTQPPSFPNWHSKTYTSWFRFGFQGRRVPRGLFRGANGALQCGQWLYRCWIVVWYPCAVVSCALMLDNMVLHQSEQHSLRILARKWQSQPSGCVCWFFIWTCMSPALCFIVAASTGQCLPGTKSSVVQTDGLDDRHVRGAQSRPSPRCRWR